MSQKLPRITAKQIIKVLRKKRFSLIRQSGSHQVYRNEEGVWTTVPFHSGVILKPKTLKAILDDCNISVEELRELL